MYVCLCKGLNNRAIRRCIREEGARTVGGVARRCGAGTVCGACRPDVEAILQSETGAERSGEDALAAK